MAAVPRGRTELDHDAEELAILQAAGPRLSVDLVVEDSGDPAQLRERLQEIGTLPVVHLSCHGRNGRGADKGPALLMEDEAGDERPIKAGELITTLDPHRPQLIFLSACLSAAPGDAEASESDADAGIAYSFATELLRADIPVVLGWGGSVADTVATSFAKDFYAGLAAGQRPADAAAKARRALLANAGTVSGPNKDAAFTTRIGARNRAKASEWHFARLWLGPTGGGPVAEGTKSRWKQRPGYERKLMMDARDSDSAVCPPELYVGRRRELQGALRAMRDTAHLGVMIHGLGLQGKSSLAWRIVTRRRDLRFVFVFKRYDARSVVDDLERALATHPAAARMLRALGDKVRDASSLQDFLIRLLHGPCAWAGDGAILLLIDDLERILEPGPVGSRHVVRFGEREVLAAIFRAFDLARGDSRLLVTSRYTFTLPDGLERCLVEVPLPTLSDKAQQNLALRRHDAFAATVTPTNDQITRLGAARKVARGHPGLQDVLCNRALSGEPGSSFTPLLDEVDAHLAGGPVPVDPELQGLMTRLDLAQPFRTATTADRALLQAATLFGLPVPRPALEALATELGGSVARLIDLGLLEVAEDIVDPKTAALAPSPLIRPRLEKLSDAAQRQFAALTAPALLDAWGGPQNRDRPGMADFELTRLGLLGEHDAVVVASAAKAVIEQQRHSELRQALELGLGIVSWLDERHAYVPWSLLSVTGSIAGRLGKGHVASEFVGRAIESFGQARARGERIDPQEAASVEFEQARWLTIQGKYEEAQVHAEHAIAFATAVSNARDVAVSQAMLADILDRSGKPNEAAKIIYQAIQTMEELGEMKHLAAGIGILADVQRSLNQLDMAIDTRQSQQIPLLERLNDDRSLIMARINLALLLVQKRNFATAKEILQDCLEKAKASEHADAVVGAVGYLAGIKLLQGCQVDLDELHRTLGLAMAARMSDGIVTIAGALAAVLKREGKLEEAIEFLWVTAAESREIGMDTASSQLEKIASGLA